jgi:SAM-dependent methyltransferase
MHEGWYLNPECGPYFLDSYHARAAIVQAVRDVLPGLRGTVLDVGCGHMPYRPLLLSPPGNATQYLGMDLGVNLYQNQPDITWDGKSIPLPDESVDSALATEVLEHCPDPARVLAEIRRVLKPGGVLLVTVPFLWPLHDVPYDEYRYTPFALERLLREAGYEDICVTALGGWDASLAQMIGLWVRRRPMPELARRVLQRLALPLYRWLLAHDTKPVRWDKPGMITGLSACAKRPMPES